MTESQHRELVAEIKAALIGEERYLQEWLEDWWTDDSDVDQKSAMPEWFTDDYVPQFVQERLKRTIRNQWTPDVQTDGASVRDIKNWWLDQFSQDSWDHDQMAEDFAESFDENVGWGKKRVREHMNAIVHLTRVKGYQDRGVLDDKEFHWDGPQDDGTTDACTWLKEQTEDGVSHQELEQLKLQARARFVDDPPSDPHLVHDFCRHQMKERYDR